MNHPGPRCSVCEHVDAKNINTALLAGAPVREVASRYHLDRSTLNRHDRKHLRPRLTAVETRAAGQVQAIEDHAAHLDVMTAMRDLHQRTLALLDKAEASNDIHVALRAVREARGNLELLGRLDGSLDGPVAPTSGDIRVTINYVDKAVILPARTPAMLTDGSDPAS